MTLVIAKNTDKGFIICSDTKISRNDVALQPLDGSLKALILREDFCICYATNSICNAFFIIKEIYVKYLDATIENIQTFLKKTYSENIKNGFASPDFINRKYPNPLKENI